MKAFIQITKILFLLIGLIIASCKTQKKTENTKPLVNDESGRLDFKTGRVLSNKMKQNEFKYTYLTTKFSVTADIDSQVNSFDVTLRAKKDSVIWISISPALGIEAARVLITSDSVKFMNKLNKTYFKGDYAYISKLFNTELDFDMLESLLIGNSVNFYDEDEKLKSSKETIFDIYTGSGAFLYKRDVVIIITDETSIRTVKIYLDTPLKSKYKKSKTKKRNIN